MVEDWVLTLTFDGDASQEVADAWEDEMTAFDGAVAHIPGHGVGVTVYAPGDLSMLAAFEKVGSHVMYTVGREPAGLEIVRESEFTRRAQEPTLPELMSASEIADLLGVKRQRVHQLRSTAAFPAPLAELRGGAVWDAAAVRKFAREWTRKPGRPWNR